MRDSEKDGGANQKNQFGTLWCHLELISADMKKIQRVGVHFQKRNSLKRRRGRENGLRAEERDFRGEKRCLAEKSDLNIEIFFLGSF